MQYYNDIIKGENFKVQVTNPPFDVCFAVDFIHAIKRKNKFNFKLSINLDYTIPEQGVYYFNDDIFSIYVNPDNCKKSSCFGYPDNETIFGVLIHEFCHFLSMRYLKNFIKEYLEEFPEQRLNVSSYDLANKEYEEEVAEIMSLHLRNPYFLKLISKEHYNFMQKRIKSYVPCTAEKFIEIYNDMDKKIKEKVFNKYGIVINHADRTVIKT